jgi:hypothetical protein
MLSEVATAASPNVVTQFRARREGPEALMQDVVVDSIPALLSPTEHSWTASSLPLGAGIPDLVIVSYKPQVFMLAQVELQDAQILAYLRAVGKARLETIAERIGGTPGKLSCRLYNLVEAEAVVSSSDIFSLTPVWRQILPEIVTIEIKVANWQRAIEQAARNRIFAHMSFVALPEKVAQRIRAEPILRKLGIGLISVTDNGTAIAIRKPRRKPPTVWTYYYQLASILARSRVN